MKKVLSLLFALVLMCCAVASVSAEDSPTAPGPDDFIIVDAVPVPEIAGSVTPEINNPAKVEIGSDETVTLTATPVKGYKFSHWEFKFGEFEIVEGDLTTPVIVIKPTGTGPVRAEANFVEEGADVTTPSSKPVGTLAPDVTSPITGSGSTGTLTGSIVTISILVMAVGAVVVLKKKSNA